MKKPILLLALSSILYSTVTIADYKINITSPVLNQKTTFGEVVPSAPDLIPFDETGVYGNIALIGTNGITEESITSLLPPRMSTTRDVNLFDGYQRNDLINDSSNGRIGVGFYESSSYQNTNQSFTIDLGREASLSGFRVLSHSPTAPSYLPKDIRIESSVDGVSFTPEESITLIRKIDSGVISMSTPFTSRYFRFYVVNAYDIDIIAFGEIEIFQTQ
jgi:hypothetical protein